MSTCFPRLPFGGQFCGPSLRFLGGPSSGVPWPPRRGSRQRPWSGAPTSWSGCAAGGPAQEPRSWRPLHWLLPALRQRLHGPVWCDLGALYEPLHERLPAYVFYLYRDDQALLVNSRIALLS